MAILTTCTLTFIDLNEIHIGDAPANPTNNELWFDTINNILKKYNSKSKIWEVVNDYTQDIIDALEGLQVSSRNLLASTSYESQIICTNTSNKTGAEFAFVRTIDYVKNIKDKEITVAFDWELVTSTTPSGTFRVQTTGTQVVQIGDITTISNSNYYGTCAFTTTLKAVSGITGIHFRTDLVTGTFKITHPRLFYGSKDLGWTQAPEDLTTQFETIINKQADGVYISVADKDNDIKSLVSFDSKKVVIDSANIDLKGYVTITSLSDPSSTTTIDGNLIETDTLSANKIKTGKIQGKNSNSYFNLDNGTFSLANATQSLMTFNGTSLTFQNNVNYNLDKDDFSSNLGWIKNWTEGSTTINSKQVLSPMAFFGTVNTSKQATGISLGGSLNEIYKTEGIYNNVDDGIAGYKLGTKTFHLKTDGTLMIGPNTTGNYLSWDGSNLNVRASSLNIGSEVVATTNNVSDAVNNIQIGGRNLIKNSNFFNNIKYWTAENLTVSIVDEPYYVKALKITTPSNNRIYQNTSNIWKTGQSYVVSFYAKSSTNGGTIRPSRSISDFGTTQTLTTEWQRYSCIFKSSITTEGGTLSLSFSNADEIYITQIQLEYGNKASDWTPAQEDVDASISSVSSALGSLDSSVKSAFGDGIINDSEAKALASNIQILNNEKSDIDKEYATIYTNPNLSGTAKTNLASAKTSYDSAHSSLISSINTVTADKIITTDERNSVESFFTTYRTKIADYKQRLQEALDYISTKKVDNIQIGGRNLVLNSSTLNDQFSQLGTFKGTRTVLDDSTAKSGKSITVECTTAGTGFYCNIWLGDESCIGKEYTWSFYAKMNTSKTLVNIGHERNGRKSIPITTEWQKFTHTWTYSSTGNRAFTFYSNFVAGDIFYIKDLKIEEGNKCSDWSPAPEDVDTAINNVDTKVISTTARVSTIETDLSSITLRVGTAESTLTTTTTELGKVDGKISDAKSSAVNTASSDATSKANSAKTAAINAAASDATSKANAAQAAAVSTAKGYTDGQVTTVNETITSKVADIKITTDSITSRVESTESSITTHTTELGKVDGKINTAVNLGTLYVKGTGYNRPTNRIVQLNGTNIVNNGSRGFNVTVINRNNLTVRSNTIYDVYVSDDAKNNMSNALNALTDDCIIVITSWDAIATNDSLDAAIARCGGTGTRFGGTFHRVPYALVGIPNIGKGSGIEVFTTVAIDAPYAEINTKIVNGIPEGISTNSRELYSSISTTNSKVSTIESNLSGITSRVSTAESNISTANGNITSLTERVRTAEQKITDDSIVATVTKSQTDGKNTFIQQSDITQLNDSWSATFKDGYNQGITTINKDGITVTSSNVKSKTSMSASGFKITKTDTNQDIFSVNSDGTLSIIGNINGGSININNGKFIVDSSGNVTTAGKVVISTQATVPASTLSGSIASSQLDSTITNDISSSKEKSDLLAQGLNKWMLTAYDITGAGYTTATIPTFNMLSNKNVKFIKEVLDSATSITMNLDNNYIGHAKTNIYLDSAYSYTGTLTTDDAGALYLNGSLVATTVSCTAKSITLSLKDGWNTVEVLFTEIGGGDGFVLSPKFSATTQIKRINSYEVSSVNIVSKLTSETKDVLDTNKTNWGNAYNRVNEWASGAVTGSTTINGGFIETNTISAKHIAIGDFNNYSQLTKGKNLVNGYGTATWVEGTSSNSYWQSSNSYFPFTIDETLNSFKPGDKVQIKFDACTVTSRNVTVGIWFYSDYNSSASTGSITGLVSCTASWGTKTIVLTLPTGDSFPQNAKSIAILILNGTSGELIKVRNVTILRQVAGDLIVDGSITTDHINTNGLNASVIKAGTIDADRIDANTIVSKVNGATTTVSGNKIKTGQISANSGGSYLNLDNGSMMLGTTSLTSYLQWTGSALNIKASSLSISGVSAATTSDVSSAKTQAVNEASGVKDTRTTNQNPDWYIANYPQRTIQEFKTLAILGLTGDGTYGTLETKIPWANSSGGYPTQTFFGSNADVFMRRGLSGTTWSEWVRKANATQSDVFNALTNNSSTQGIYLNNGEVYLNASMIKTGTLDAKCITTETLTGKTLSAGTISGGSININNAFKVDSSGKMTATGADITGKITVSTGSVVPTSTLDGKVTSTQLHSDVNTSISDAATSATNANNKIDGLEIGGRNLIRTSYITNRGCTTYSYNSTNNTWTCVAPKNSGSWGYGFLIDASNKIPIEKGRTLIISLEVNPDVDCQWNNDVNNSYVGNSAGGNDNDDTSKRAYSSRSLKAGIWNKCWFSYTAKDNVSYDLYEYRSNWGIITTTADISFKFRNVKGEYGNRPTDWCIALEDTVASVDTMYYLSTSSTSQSGGSWTTAFPTNSVNKFIWTKTITTYAAGSPSETTPVLYQPDWVQDWDSTKTTITGTSVLAPKIFAGTKETNGTATGVALGSNVFGTGNDYSGLAGYKSGTKTFHFKTDGTLLIGQNTTGNHIYWDGSNLSIKANTINIGTQTVATTTNVNDAISSSKTILDTRSKNENPLWYFTNYPRQTITEFKYANIIGVGTTAVYGTLETKTPWTEKSGGYPVQIFRSNSTPTYERKGTSDTTWGTWTQIEDTVGAQAKATQALSDANSFTTTKVSSVESTVSGITARVSSIEGKGYQTSSQVQQTVDKLELKFEQSGGYNLIRNSAFKNGQANWSSMRWDTTAGGGEYIEVVYPEYNEWTPANRNSLGACILNLPASSSGKPLRCGFDCTPFTVKPNTTYTLNCLMAAHRVWSYTIEMICYDASGNRITDSSNGVTIFDPKTGGRDRNNWNNIKHSFTTQSGSASCHLRAFMNEWNGSMNNAFMWICEPIVTEGDVQIPWTPSADEMYSGITTIDSDGITINMIDGGTSRGSSKVSHLGIATYDQWGNNKSWFSDENAFIKELQVENIKNDYLIQCKPRNTNWYVGQYATGDGSGRDYNNKSNSVNSVLDYVRRNYGCYSYRQDLNIFCDNGMSLNETIIISGWMGSGFVYLTFGKDCTFVGNILVEECTMPVYIEGGKTGFDNNDGCMWYRGNGLGTGSALQVRHSSVMCIGFRSHANITAYGYSFVYATYGSDVSIVTMDLVNYWSISNSYHSSIVYINSVRGVVGLLSEQTNNATIVAQTGLPLFEHGKRLDGFYNAVNHTDGPDGYNSLWYPKPTPEAPAPSVPAPPSQSWHWVEKTFYFNLSSTTEGSGSNTSGWTDKWGQGSWGIYKSHRGHARPTESISDWVSGSRNISMNLTMTRLSVAHGNHSNSPVPKLLQKDGYYWDSGVGFNLGDTKTIGLSSGVVAGLSDGSLGELTMWAGSTNSQYSQYNNTYLTVTCEKYY